MLSYKLSDVLMCSICGGTTNIFCIFTVNRRLSSENELMYKEYFSAVATAAMECFENFEYNSKIRCD